MDATRDVASYVASVVKPTFHARNYAMSCRYRLGIQPLFGDEWGVRGLIPQQRLDIKPILEAARQATSQGILFCVYVSLISNACTISLFSTGELKFKIAENI